MTISEVVDAMLKSTLRGSESRPSWLVWGGAKVDAPFRLSVALSAPALVVIYSLMAFWLSFAPALRETMGLKFAAAGAYVVTHIGAQMYLSGRLSYIGPENGAASEQHVSTVRRIVVVANAVYLLCIPAWCILLFFHVL